MQNVSELFNELITPYLDENGLTITIHDEEGGFKANIKNGEKGVCSVSLSVADILLHTDDVNLRNVIRLYVSQTINQCGSSKGD